jgi:5-methylcytosine-specific restriction endonuclease McrA
LFAQAKLQSPIHGQPAQPIDERRREHIANATRRAIVERDGLRCTFVSNDGCRCESRTLLQIHHEKPWANGGGPELENLRLLCATHNRLLAEKDFGAQNIAQRIAARRTPDAKAHIAGE